MRKLTLTLSLVFTVTLSSPSYAKWTKVGESVSGDIYYVDFERIRKHDGYVYFWVLENLLKPDKYGDLSVKTYYQSDCKLFRHKRVTASYHTQPMGEGTPSASGASKNQQWDYPSPNSIGETVLKSVCSR